MLNFWRKIGSAIVFAGAAVGVSHLVQATRAGASYGYDLWWLIILVHIAKYPFFEYSSRYTIATRKTVIDFINKCNPLYTQLYLLFNVLVGSTVVAAILMVSTGILAQFIEFNFSLLALLLISVASTQLILGSYKKLELISKIAMIALTIILSLVAALSFKNFDSQNLSLSLQTQVFDFTKKSDFTFLIALLGWMPSPLDLCWWNSIWTKAKLKNHQGSYKNVIKDHFFDQQVAYYLTAILALLFLVLGANLIHYNHEATLEINSSVGFIKGLVSTFTEVFGDASFAFIAIIIFLCMYSTLITCIDGYTRSTYSALENLNISSFFSYKSLIIIYTLAGSLIITFFKGNMLTLVDFVTILSFVLAPIFAQASIAAINSTEVNRIFKPGLVSKLNSYFGLAFLTLFSLVYIYYKFL
jgi:Mn2+/Fe2+ NRAMP family transporter